MHTRKILGLLERVNLPSRESIAVARGSRVVYEDIVPVGLKYFGNLREKHLLYTVELRVIGMSATIKW